MGFEELIGQELIINTLQASLASGSTSHAYLFSGPPGSGKRTISLTFARALNCTGPGNVPCECCLSCRKCSSGSHPDLYLVKPQGASVKMEQLREIKDSLYYYPSEGFRKVCIIVDADLVTLPAANSLLKILEEPPGDLVFMLLSSRPWAVLPTIVSRCCHFALKPLSAEEMERLLDRHASLSGEEKGIVAALAGGNPGKALELSGGGNFREQYEKALIIAETVEEGTMEELFSRAEELAADENLNALLELLLIIYRDRLVSRLSGRGAGKNVLISSSFPINNKYRCETALKTGYRLEKICSSILYLQAELSGNVNRRMALETLFLKMRGVV